MQLSKKERKSKSNPDDVMLHSSNKSCAFRAESECFVSTRRISSEEEKQRGGPDGNESAHIQPEKIRSAQCLFEQTPSPVTLSSAIKTDLSCLSPPLPSARTAVCLLLPTTSTVQRRSASRRQHTQKRWLFRLLAANSSLINVSCFV